MQSAQNSRSEQFGRIWRLESRPSHCLSLGVGAGSDNRVGGCGRGAGTVVVDSNVKKVEHLIGGIISELLVHNGDVVKAGQVIVRLDDTQARSNLAIHTKRLDELMARQAREEAERDGAERIVFLRNR